ncbi:MAG: Asp-tRNA(Asn)/Glu-tRNA(Gln) amidotransferase subunit GatC [Candidatus Nealsonbacteria bacterium]|nr:Asp-tRNA(Asn)/Glu-tRNA(Gln) amidotransferase subunit GatC [Candidatus Nealsonbacteria bacterium]
MINKEGIRHVAKLARFELDSQEEDLLEKDLVNILGYIEKLKSLDVSGVSAMSHPINIKNDVREDNPIISDERKDVIDLFNDRDGGFLKVRSIL